MTRIVKMGSLLALCRDPTVRRTAAIAHGPQQQLIDTSGRRTFIGQEACKGAFSDYIGRRGGDPSLIRWNFRDSGIVNPITKRKLEIDMFYEPWKIGVEYNGEQHYVYPNIYHPATEKGEKEFHAAVQRDHEKLRQARALGIRIIVVPYTVDKKIKGHHERREAILTFLDSQ